MTADFVAEDHLLQTYDQVWLADVSSADGTLLRRAGTVDPGRHSGARRTFRNTGGGVQLLFTPNEAISIVGGARIDHHNIYGLQPSARLGAVYAAPDRPVSVKLLYGSSFKAPSAQQLYSQPAALLDIQGNPSLLPQTAHTVEVSGGYTFSAHADVSLNVFATYARDRVEFIQSGLFLQAQNVGSEWVMGGELEARWRPLPSLRLRGAAGFARTLGAPGANLLTSALQVRNPLFPALQIHGAADYTLPWLGLKVGAEASYVGSRSSSQSNALRNSAAYAMPGYAFTAASLTMPARPVFGQLESRASLRVSNVLNTHYADPGFGGVDVPAQGIAAMLTWVQSL